jgi:RNA polymerase sigma factor (sigma-70 family)
MGVQLDEASLNRRFKEVALPHLTAAYRLARWLIRNHEDAEDVVQEAYLSAFKQFNTYRGGNALAWILAIVRNACYTRLRKQPKNQFPLDEERAFADGAQAGDDWASIESNPEAILLRRLDGKMVQDALEKLPAEFREVMILRTYDELSYNEIAVIADIPIGTVMSRLARARQHLIKCLKSVDPELK